MMKFSELMQENLNYTETKYVGKVDMDSMYNQ